MTTCMDCGSPQTLPIKDCPPLCIACFAEREGVAVPPGNNREVVVP